MLFSDENQVHAFPFQTGDAMQGRASQALLGIALVSDSCALWKLKVEFGRGGLNPPSSNSTSRSHVPTHCACWDLHHQL